MPQRPSLAVNSKTGQYFHSMSGHGTGFSFGGAPAASSGFSFGGGSTAPAPFGGGGSTAPTPFGGGGGAPFGSGVFGGSSSASAPAPAAGGFVPSAGGGGGFSMPAASGGGFTFGGGGGGAPAPAFGAANSGVFKLENVSLLKEGDADPIVAALQRGGISRLVLRGAPPSSVTRTVRETRPVSPIASRSPRRAGRL